MANGLPLARLTMVPVLRNAAMQCSLGMTNIGMYAHGVFPSQHNQCTTLGFQPMYSCQQNMVHDLYSCEDYSKIVVISLSQNDFFSERGRWNGCCGFLIKPVSHLAIVPPLFADLGEAE